MVSVPIAPVISASPVHPAIPLWQLSRVPLPHFSLALPLALTPTPSSSIPFYPVPPLISPPCLHPEFCPPKLP